MTRQRTAQATYETIEKLALRSFAKHELVERHSLPSKSTSGEPAPFIGTFRVGEKNSSIYAFLIHVDTAVVCVWGDLGEYVLRHNDGDSLRWLLDAGCGPNAEDGAHYCDYFLSKVRAIDHQSRTREFMIDDARAFVDQWERDINQEYADFENTEDDAKHRAEKLAQVAQVREELSDMDVDAPEEQRRRWQEIMHEVGYEEPPSCDGWSPAMLWLWQAVKLFRRLYKANKRAAAIAEPTKSMRTCTCLGECKGAAGLAEGWLCALAKPVDQPAVIK